MKVRGSGANALTSYGKPVCSQVQGPPNYGSGQVPGGSTPDRRRLSVAVVNCIQSNVSGSSTNVPVKDWLEVFLVEPSISRGNGGSSVTNAGDVYAEVIGETTAGGGGATAGQVVRRDVPYLVR